MTTPALLTVAEVAALPHGTPIVVVFPCGADWFWGRAAEPSFWETWAWRTSAFGREHVFGTGPRDADPGSYPEKAFALCRLDCEGAPRVALRETP